MVLSKMNGPALDTGVGRIKDCMTGVPKVNEVMRWRVMDATVDARDGVKYFMDEDLPRLQP